MMQETGKVTGGISHQDGQGVSLSSGRGGQRHCSISSTLCTTRQNPGAGNDGYYSGAKPGRRRSQDL